MFSKQLLMRHKLAQNLYRSRPLISRFGFCTKVPDSETVISEQDYYTPAKTIEMSNGKFLVFDNKTKGHWKYGAPYEVKETVVKNSIGIIAFYFIELHVAFMFYMPTAFFTLQMAYRVTNYMSRAVDYMELLECGTKVSVKFKVGGQATWNIMDILKVEDEKALVETFDEPYLFPINVQGKGIYYMYGDGHRAIKDGEIFRAIINGKSIALD